MTAFRQLAIKVKAHIVKNETQQAIQELRAALQDHPHEKTIVIRAAQQSGLEQKLLINTLSNEEANIDQNQIHLALLALAELLAKEEIEQTKIFISYNRGSISTSLAYELRKRIMAEGFQVFMDVEDIPVGADWGTTIIEELRSCHYFLLLLSEKANCSEMVAKETKMAFQFREEFDKPITIPIRVQFPFEKRLNPKLNALLHRIHQLEWRSEKDSNPIIDRVLEVLHCRKILPDIGNLNTTEFQTFTEIDEELPLPIAPLEISSGAVRLDSKYYITRAHEESFIHSIQFPGAILRIQGPRQFGKTSLLARVVDHALKQNYHVVSIDFQEIERSTMSSLEKFLEKFCTYFADEFNVETKLQKRQGSVYFNKQNCTTFIERDILREIQGPVLLAIDEADRLFAHPEVSSEFFMLLRSWHEKSKLPNRREWEKFRLVLSYSSEAKLAIQDINASPFNVGEEAKLKPFNASQITDLANRHGLNWGKDKIEGILNLLGGQPYLTRRAMYLVAKGEYSFDQLIAKADRDDGPFSDHLRHHLINLRQYEDIAASMRMILSEGKCNDPIRATRIEAAGLIKGSFPKMVPACELYKRYLPGKL